MIARKFTFSPQMEYVVVLLFNLLSFSESCNSVPIISVLMCHIRVHRLASFVDLVIPSGALPGIFMYILMSKKWKEFEEMA